MRSAIVEYPLWLLSISKEKKRIKEGRVRNQNLSQRTLEKVATLKRQSEKGDAVAMYQLGNMYLEGEEVGYDPDLGRQFFEASAKKGSFDANYALALYYKGYWSYPHADAGKSRYYYLMAQKCPIDNTRYAQEVQRAINEDFQLIDTLWVFKNDIPINMK